MEKQLNIVGWSPYRHSGGVTGHLLSMSYIAANLMKMNVGIRADHFAARPIEGYIGKLRGVMPVSREIDFYSNVLYPGYIKWYLIYETRLNNMLSKVRNGFKVEKNLSVLLPIIDKNESLFGNNTGDACFVDSSGAGHMYFEKTVCDADMVLIFLPGNTYGIRNFFKHYNVDLRKSFFIINCHSEAEEGAMHILSEFGIAENRKMLIPYCREYKYASNAGAIDEYVRREMEHEKTGTYVDVIKCITSAVIKECEKMKGENYGSY